MSETDEKRIIEINGVKLEIDLRTAKRIDCYHVGDSVKVLIKQYSDQYASYPAVIVGLTEYKERPCIELLYVKGDGDVAFLALNKDSKDIEIAPFNEYEYAFEREAVHQKLDEAVARADEAARSARSKRDAFQKFFEKVTE